METRTTQTTKDNSAKGSALLSIDELPTAVGAIPPALAAKFESVPVPTLPEMTRLPRPRERCPITGASRTWLIEQNDALPPSEKFIFRIRQRGKMRGAVFLNVAKLMTFMEKAQAGGLTE